MKIFSYKSVGSTMDIAKEKVKKDQTLLQSGCVVVARKQTCGRGTKGRVWMSDSEDGLYYTMVCNPAYFSIDQSEDYQFLISFCVKSVLDELSGLTCDI